MEGGGSSSAPNNDISGVEKIMRDVIPEDVTISEEAMVIIEKCVDEFIAHITKEANENCQREDRTMVTSEDLVSAMSKLGFDDCVEFLTNGHNQNHENVAAAAAAGGAREGVVAAVSSNGEVIILDGPIVGHGDDEKTDSEKTESDESDDE